MKKNFREQCYEKIREVPQGFVTTYKDIALALNSKGYRAVGTAMATNTDIPNTPCHRVIKNNGEVGKYALGTDKKINLLRAEGIKIEAKKINLKKFRWKF